MPRTIALLLLCGLAACAGVPTYPRVSATHEEPVTRAYRASGHAHPITGVRYQALIRPYDAQGKFGLCQLYLVDGVREQVESLAWALEGPESYVEFESRDGRTLRISPRGAPVRPAQVGGFREIPQNEQALCGAAQEPFDAELAEGRISVRATRSMSRAADLPRPRTPYNRR